MPKHHSEDYKSAAVQHYIDKGSTMREVCETFQCSFQSLKRWIDKYQCEGNVAYYYYSLSKAVRSFTFGNGV